MFLLKKATSPKFAFKFFIRLVPPVSNEDVYCSEVKLLFLNDLVFFINLDLLLDLFFLFKSNNLLSESSP